MKLINGAKQKKHYEKVKKKRLFNKISYKQIEMN